MQAALIIPTVRRSPPSPAGAAWHADMQPPGTTEAPHWARALPDRRAVPSFPAAISDRFMSAMSIQMAVITNRSLVPVEQGTKMATEQEVKLAAEQEDDTVSLEQHHEKKVIQKKDNKTKLSKLLAVRKVVYLA